MVRYVVPRATSLNLQRQTTVHSVNSIQYGYVLGHDIQQFKPG